MNENNLRKYVRLIFEQMSEIEPYGGGAPKGTITKQTEVLGYPIHVWHKAIGGWKDKDYADASKTPLEDNRLNRLRTAMDYIIAQYPRGKGSDPGGIPPDFSPGKYNKRGGPYEKLYVDEITRLKDEAFAPFQEAMAKGAVELVDATGVTQWKYVRPAFDDYIAAAGEHARAQRSGNIIKMWKLTPRLWISAGLLLLALAAIIPVVGYIPRWLQKGTKLFGVVGKLLGFVKKTPVVKKAIPRGQLKLVDDFFEKGSLPSGKTAAEGTGRVATRRGKMALSTLDDEKAALERMHDILGPASVEVKGVKYASTGEKILQMERVPGMNLDELLKSGKWKDLSPDEILSIRNQIGDALGKLHNAKFGHGDLFPRNIMITPKNRVVFIDPAPSLPSDFPLMVKRDMGHWLPMSRHLESAEGMEYYQWLNSKSTKGALPKHLDDVADYVHP